MKKIGINDFTFYNYPTGITASPDGKHAAIAVVNANEKDNTYDSCLWIHDTVSKKTRKLTSGKKERTFIWLDNETLLFTSDREKEYAKKVKDGEDWTCFYKISIYGGEAQFAFAVPYKVTKMQLAGTKLVLGVKYDYNKPDFAHMEGEEKEEALKAWKDEKDYEVFDELPFWANGQGIVNKKRTRLAVYDMETGDAKIVSPEYDNVEGFWTEEGNKVLFISSHYTDKKDVYEGLKMYTISEDKVETLVEQGDMSIDYACILNGKVTFFASYMKEYGFNENDKLYTVENGKVELLSDYDDSIHNSICCDCKFADGPAIVHDDKYIYFLTTLRKNTALRRFDANGNLETLIDRQGSLHTLSLCGDKIYFTGMREMGLTECYCFDGKEEEKLTSFNDEIMAERSVLPVEEFTFTYKGLELDGYVIKPLDYDPNKTYPGILTIHGGPRATFAPTFFHENQVFANAGYFVFYTNPLGSDGRGNDFADLSGRHGSIDFEHCMAVTDEVLKRYPQIDEKRLGVMGGSYGGFMTNWVIGNTTRFAAAASQRSISNWISKCMTTDIGYYFNMDQIKADPWGNPEKMWSHSPLKYANMAKTPTLFIQSDEDYRCWMGDAIQMFSALKYFGVDARLCLFHGENHELSRSGKPTHRIRRMQEMMDWFDKYLN